MAEIKALENFIKTSIKSRILDIVELEKLLNKLSDQQVSIWGTSFDVSQSYSEAERVNIPYWKTKEKENNFIAVNLKNAYSPTKDDFGKYIFDRQHYQKWLLNRIKNVIDISINEKLNETSLDKVSNFGCAFIFIGLGLIGVASLFNLDWLTLIGVILFAGSFLYFIIIRYVNKRKKTA